MVSGSFVYWEKIPKYVLSPIFFCMFECSDHKNLVTGILYLERKDSGHFTVFLSLVIFGLLISITAINWIVDN